MLLSRGQVLVYCVPSISCMNFILKSLQRGSRKMLKGIVRIFFFYSRLYLSMHLDVHVKNVNI
jgi:hypothetical protein